MLKLILLLLLHVTTDRGVLAESRTNFDVKKFEKCATDGPVEYSLVITKKNQQQFMDGYLNSPIPLDENIGLNMFIESALEKNVFLPLFTIREKDFCKAMNKYLGEFWYDIERAAQIIPKTCPISAGRYRLHHVLLDFTKLTLQTFPFGTLRLTLRAIEKRANKTIFCMIMVVDNLEN